jgi:hypothetical protein
MPEFELDQESILRAEKLSSQLMKDFRTVSAEAPSLKISWELFSEERYAEQAEEVPINDVVANIGQMAMEFAIVRRSGGRVLSLKLDNGEMAPISMTEFFGGPLWPYYAAEDWIEFWEKNFPFPFSLHSFWRDIYTGGAQDERVMMTDVREAEGGLERSLKGFLSYRFAGMKKWAEWIQGAGFSTLRRKGAPQGRGAGSSPPPPPAVGPGGGLQVQVSCLTPGLRIHVSPAYFISWVFFGSPTTPVTNYLLPGRYVFSGDGPMQPIRRTDPGVFSIPPTYYPTLARF